MTNSFLPEWLFKNAKPVTFEPLSSDVARGIIMSVAAELFVSILKKAT